MESFPSQSMAGNAMVSARHGMSELQIIERALKGAAQRRRWERAWRGAWQGLLAGAVLWLVSHAAYKLAPVPFLVVPGAAIGATILLVGGLVKGFWRRPSLSETARWIDGKEHLQERISTAWEFSVSSPAGEWKELLLHDAARSAEKIDARALVPFRLHTAAKWALLALILNAGLGFAPEYRTKQFLQKQQDAATIEDTGKHLAEFTRRNLEQRPPLLEPTQKGLEAVTEIGDKLGKAKLTRAEALRDLSSVSEKLAQQAKELGENPAFKPLERAARDQAGSGNQSHEALQQQMDALQKALGNAAGKPDALDKLKNDLQKAEKDLANMSSKDAAAAKAAREQLAQSLSQMSQQLREMGQSLSGLDDAIKALENSQPDAVLKDLQAAVNDLDKLREMAKAMQQLQQQAARLGKDLAEQLQNGQAQAAQKTLQIMIEQIKSANLSREQLQNILQEVSKAVQPGTQYGKVGDFLKNAAGQLEQGAKPGAAQSLAQAASELEKLMRQMEDAQSLQAALAALERAQTSIALGKNWSECQGPGCEACNGLGCDKCMGKSRGWRHGGKPGGGVGTWADETGWTFFPDKMEKWDNSDVKRPDMDPRGHSDRGDDLNPNLMPTKLRGQMSPGGPMPSITLKGLSIKGQSSVPYQEAASAAQAEAQSALNQDRVPRAYQGAVRDYFDDLKK
jgi:hypothetical protein